MPAWPIASVFEAGHGARALARALLLSAAATVAACSTTATAPRTLEFLDESTGASVSAVARPLVFARERSELAANARDYVCLSAAILDSGGHLQYVIVGYQWSTVDARLDDRRASDDAAVVLMADDRRFVLTPSSSSARDIGLEAPLQPPSAPHRAGRLYITDLPTLRFLSAARQLQLRVGNDELTSAFQLWEDGRGSLGLLLDPGRP